VSLSFYKAVLPPEGPYCVWGNSKNRIAQTFHDTLEEVITRGSELDRQQYNAFFALASFKESTSREVTNVKGLRSFFIDLDCGPGKPYADQTDGALALRRFVDDAHFPKPYIVNSGRGLHAYWPIHEVLSAPEWGPIARSFKALVCSKLKVDPVVSADAARVLRMPDTTHYKGSPLPVQIIQDGDITPLADFLKLLPEVAVDLSAAKAYGVDAMTRSLAAGDYPPSEFSRIVRRSMKGTGCAQIAHAVENAATLEEPLWRAALSIAWLCTDAETAIHTLSRSHPEYTPESTTAKAELTKGPMTCEWYRNNYPDHCAGCQQQITSPISLGTKVEAAQAVDGAYVVDQQLEPDTEAGTSVQVHIPEYPYPYFRGLHGGVYKRAKDEKGEPIEVMVYRYDLYLTSRYYDSTEHGDGEGEVVGINLHMPHDGIRRFTAPVTVVLTKEKMRDLLLKHGVVAINKELDLLMAYLASSIRNLQKQFAADKTRSQMGWTPDNLGFVIGELEYTSNNIRLAPSASGTKLVAPMLVAKGELAKWSQMVNFYDRPGMEAHALTLFFGFGAPLLRMLGGMEVRGATINLMSNKSGTGKTTVQMMVNSIFGHPSKLLMKKSDTTMSKMQWLGMLNTIAVTMDEVTNMTDEEISELVYDVPQGRGKHRMESQTNKLRANVVSWATFVITSSNSSLYDKLSRLKSTSDGEMRRLIELRINRPVAVTKAESDAVFSALSDNYGLAGPVFMQYVMRNRDAVISLLAKIKLRIDNDLKLDQSDRFYSVVMACAFAAASIARKLGLINIDITRVYNYALETLAAIRKDVVQPSSNTELAAQEALMLYINENINCTLIISTASSGMLSAPIQTPRGPLRLRYEPDTHELWIPSAALRDCFVSRQIDSRQGIEELVQAGIIKSSTAATKRIGAGAVGNFSSMGVRSFCINGKAMGLNADMFTGTDEVSPSP
jgi:hypothetical protein